MKLNKIYILLFAISITTLLSNASEVTEYNKDILHKLLDKRAKKWFLIIGCWNYSGENTSTKKSNNPPKIIHFDNSSEKTYDLKDIDEVKYDINLMRNAFCDKEIKADRMILIDLSDNSTYPVHGRKLKAIRGNNNADTIENAISFKTDRLYMNSSNRGYPNAQNIREAVKYIANHVDTSDMVYIYYSGHGGLYKKNDYLLPLDSESNNTKSIINLKTDILEKLNNKCRLLTVITDACRSYSKQNITNNDVNTNSSLYDNLPDTTVLIMSCSPTETSETDNKSSLFTKHLYEALFERKADKFVFKNIAEFNDAQNGEVNYSEIKGYINTVFEKHNKIKKQENSDSDSINTQTPKFYIEKPSEVITQFQNLPHYLNSLLTSLSSNDSTSLTVEEMCYALDPNKDLLLKFNLISTDNEYNSESEILDEWFHFGYSTKKDYSQNEKKSLGNIFQNNMYRRIADYLKELPLLLDKIRPSVIRNTASTYFKNETHVLAPNLIEFDNIQFELKLLKEKITELSNYNQSIIAKMLNVPSLTEYMTTIDNKIYKIYKNFDASRTKSVENFESSEREAFYHHFLGYKELTSREKIQTAISYIEEEIEIVTDGNNSIDLNTAMNGLQPALNVLLQYSELNLKIKNLYIMLDMTKAIFENTQHQYSNAEINNINDNFSRYYTDITELNRNIMEKEYMTAIRYYIFILAKQPEKSLKAINSLVIALENFGEINIFTANQQNTLNYLLYRLNSKSILQQEPAIKTVFSDQQRLDTINSIITEFRLNLEKYYLFEKIIALIESQKANPRFQYEIYQKSKKFLKEYNAKVDRDLFERYFNIYIEFEKGYKLQPQEIFIDNLTPYETSVVVADKYYDFALTYYYKGYLKNSLRMISIANALVPNKQEYVILYKTICEKVQEKYQCLPNSYKVFSDDLKLSYY